MSLELDPRFVKYIRMKKMFPEEVVRHKMAMDGSFEPLDIEAFFGNVTSTVVGGGTATASPKSLSLSLPLPGPSPLKTVGREFVITDAAQDQIRLFFHKHNSKFPTANSLFELMKEDKIPAQEIEHWRKTLSIAIK